MCSDRLQRREFISLLGGAAAAWPLAARAQQPKLIRLGYLDPRRHFKMEDRSADGQLDRLSNLATELARLPVDMFVVGGEAPIRAAMQASDKIPMAAIGLICQQDRARRKSRRSPGRV